MVETCSPAINGAGFVVQEGWGFFRGLSAQTYQIAVEALSDLQSFSVMAVPTSVVFDVGESVSGFAEPPRPVIEIDDFEDVERPPDPDINEPRLIDDAGPAPNEPTLQPYIPPAGEPVNTAIAPDPRVDLEDIVVPEMDAYTLPDLPTLYELDLPDVPVIASAHPSPMSADRGFFGSRPFSRANELLDELGEELAEVDAPDEERALAARDARAGAGGGRARGMPWPCPLHAAPGL